MYELYHYQRLSCGHRIEERQISDCEGLIEDNCPGVTDIYMASRSHSSTGNPRCPTCVSVNDQDEQQQLEQENQEKQDHGERQEDEKQTKTETT